MAISAELTVVNNTGDTIMFTKVGKVNDDARFSGPVVGDTLKNEKSVKIEMANSSVFFAPMGVGVDLQFVSKSIFEGGGIYLEIPAVGRAKYGYSNERFFKYDLFEEKKTVSTVTITSVKGRAVAEAG